MFGAHFNTANAIEPITECIDFVSHCDSNAMHQEYDDDDDEACHTTSSISTNSSKSLSDYSEDDNVLKWKSESRIVLDREVKRPQIMYSNLSEPTLASLGYVSPEEWQSPEDCIQAKFVKPNLYDMLTEAMIKRRKTNYVVIIGECRFKVHLMVLQGFSGLFCDLNNNVCVQLPSERITPRAFELVYEWMITDTPRLSRHGLLEVLRAASFLKMPQLEAQCEHCLTHGFAEDSALLLYLEARLLHMERSYRPFLQRVERFFLTLVASQEFLQLPVHALWLLLCSSNICVNSELEVFMAAVRWLNFKWPKRRTIISQLLSCVRFALVPPWLLIRLPDESSTSMELRRITSHPEVLQQLHDGIGYTTTRLCYGSDREAFVQHMERSGMQPPVQRKWIYDRNCSYHHRLHCKISKELTYEDFVGYLNFLQSQCKDYWKSLEPVDASELCLCCQKQAAKS